MTQKRRSKIANEFHSEHHQCWMCRFLGRHNILQAEVHHITGRGRKREVRANFAALCRGCHQAIQSVTDAELVCLVLKWKYDPEYCDPALICELRGWATTWITEAELGRCERVMRIMREVSRC